MKALEAAFADAAETEPGYLKTEPGRIAALISRLSVMQRRDVWLSHLSQLGVSGPLQWLYPHGGGADPLTMLVVGSGGFGDVLTLTPLIRELRRAYPESRVFVVHQHPGVELLSDSPYVESARHCTHEVIERLVAIASVLDVFDLIVDVRYVVTYTAPPLSRAPRQISDPGARAIRQMAALCRDELAPS